MKTIKILMLLATISVFTSIPYAPAEARDCTDPKGFHERLMCKTFGNSGTATSDGTKKKSLGSIWEKLKNLGGKNVGEPG